MSRLVYSTETLDHWIEEIDLHGRGLTKWEEDFVDSLRDQLERRGMLSERQIEILERMYSEKTP